MDPAEIEKFEAPVKVLRLSEAIRIGAKIRPKCLGTMFLNGGSCALGAAYEGLFGHPGNEDQDGEMQAEWQGQIWAVVGRPIGIEPIYDIGIERNDTGWSREEIADWLESQGY